MVIDKSLVRKPTAFESTLLLIGIIAVCTAFFFVHNVSLNYGLFSFEHTICLLGWIILIFIVIMTAVSENSKEELKIIIGQQHDELKLLREDLRRK